MTVCYSTMIVTDILFPVIILFVCVQITHADSAATEEEESFPNLTVQCIWMTSSLWPCPGLCYSRLLAHNTQRTLFPTRCSRLLLQSEHPGAETEGWLQVLGFPTQRALPKPQQTRSKPETKLNPTKTRNSHIFSPTPTQGTREVGQASYHGAQLQSQASFKHFSFETGSYLQFRLALIMAQQELCSYASTPSCYLHFLFKVNYSSMLDTLYHVSPCDFTPFSYLCEPLGCLCTTLESKQKRQGFNKDKH